MTMMIIETSCMLWFFFFNDTATTEIYTLSLHDALPIYQHGERAQAHRRGGAAREEARRRRGGAHDRPGGDGEDARAQARGRADRKSTRLNSSHANISYAVFCLKKKTKHHITPHRVGQLL